jgi:hypothetical protein
MVGTPPASAVGGCQYVVAYAYHVDDHAYTGDRYSLGQGSRASSRYSSRSEACTASRSGYPIGSSINVFYDPANPSSAVLEAGPNWGTFGPLLIGLIFVPTGIFLLRAVKRNNGNVS